MRDNCAKGHADSLPDEPVAGARLTGRIRTVAEEMGHSSMNVLQMHSKGLPVQKVSDMSFVFSDD